MHIISRAKYATIVVSLVVAVLLAGVTILALVEAGRLLDHTSQKLRTTEQRLQVIERAAPEKQDAACLAWWFGHDATNQAKTRKRLCGK